MQSNSQPQKFLRYRVISEILDELRGLGWPVVEHMETQRYVFMSAYGAGRPRLESSALKTQEDEPQLACVKELLNEARKVPIPTISQEHKVGQVKPEQVNPPELEPLVLIEDEQQAAECIEHDFPPCSLAPRMAISAPRRNSRARM
jgi:hypothetical protein